MALRKISWEREMDITRSHDPTNNVYPQTKKLVLNVQNTQPHSRQENKK